MPAPPVDDADRILLVDDDPINLDLLRHALDGQGYRLFITRSGENAIEAHFVGVPKGTAAISGKSVPGEIDRVDVGRANRVPFFEDLRSLIDHHVHAAPDDLAVGNRPSRDAGFARRATSMSTRVDSPLRTSAVVSAEPIELRRP